MKSPRLPRVQVTVDWSALLAALRSLNWNAITRLMALIACIVMVGTGKISADEFLDVLPLLVSPGQHQAGLQGSLPQNKL
jgi:hypothetical protein